MRESISYGRVQKIKKISDLGGILDNFQFRECQKQKNWHERLKKESNDEIRLEITRRLLDSEDKIYKTILEIVRLLKGTRSTIESLDPTLESTRLDVQLDDLITAIGRL